MASRPAWEAGCLGLVGAWRRVDTPTCCANCTAGRHGLAPLLPKTRCHGGPAGGLSSRGLLEECVEVGRWSHIYLWGLCCVLCTDLPGHPLMPAPLPRGQR